jgi:Protein of unknown function (DUF2946)
MRRRLQRFLPVVLIALALQMVAPVVACWAAGLGASDALPGSAICHTDGTSNSADPSGQTCAHQGCCAACSLSHAAAVDAPPPGVARPLLQAAGVVWHEVAPDRLVSRAGWRARARAPPAIS